MSSTVVVSLKDLITIFFILVFAIATPINNGLIVKFNPVYTKEEVKNKANTGIISQAIFPQAIDLGTDCTEIRIPSRVYGYNDSKSWVNTNFISIPIVEEHVKDYKIIVVKAPKKFRIGRGVEAMPLIVYIVFPDDDPEGISINIPVIYFVRKVDGLSLDKEEKVDPVLIIDSNRTNTGFKSSDVFKFVKFKNKLTNPFN